MEVFGAFGAVVAAEFTGDLYCCPFCCFISPVCKFSFLKNFEIRHTAKIPQKGFGKDLPTEHGAKTLVSRVDFHWNQPSRFRGWTKMEAGSSISPRPVNFAPICSSKMLTWNHDWLPKMFFFYRPAMGIGWWVCWTSPKLGSIGPASLTWRCCMASARCWRWSKPSHVSKPFWRRTVETGNSLEGWGWGVAWWMWWSLGLVR